MFRGMRAYGRSIILRDGMHELHVLASMNIRDAVPGCAMLVVKLHQMNLPTFNVL